MSSFVSGNADSLFRNVDESALFLSGGTARDNAANLLLYGGTHPTLANTVRIRQGATDVFRVTTAGAITVTATGTNQNITLTPSGTGTTNSPTFNATSTTLGGFQGISGDTVSTPSFTWTANLNTGIYRPTTGAVAVTSAGAEVVRFDRAGTGGRRRALFTANTEIECTDALFLEGTSIRSITVTNNTTGSAANVFINSSSGVLSRSTSSIKYKTEVETAETGYSEALVYGSRPVWYRSLSESDPENWSYWGFIAEEVAEIDSRMVHWGGENADEPEGVQYDRYVVHLVNVIQKQKQQLDAFEIRLAALENP
jgi:hypothetical protein